MSSRFFHASDSSGSDSDSSTSSSSSEQIVKQVKKVQRKVCSILSRITRILGRISIEDVYESCSLESTLQLSSILSVRNHYHFRDNESFSRSLMIPNQKTRIALSSRRRTSALTRCVTLSRSQRTLARLGSLFSL